MGQPVVHFEVIGKDGEKLQSYYSELFGWEIDASNPMGYGIVPREGNTKQLGGTKVFGPDEVPGMNLVLGQFSDPEGHLIGLVQSL